MTKRRASKEQTMTLHTRAATDEIYDIFSQPLKTSTDEEEDDETDDENGDMTDGDYTDGGESTGTGRLLTTSEAEDDETSDVKSVSEWSEFSVRKHIPALDDNVDEEDTRFSTGRESDEDLAPIEMAIPPLIEKSEGTEAVTPASPDLPSNPRTMFIPIPPEDYVAPTRTYRDAAQISQNRLPFMTPIAEKTESSLGIPTARGEKDYFDLKTPSKSNGTANPPVRPPADDLCSSPFRELDDEISPERIAQPLLGKNIKTNKATAIATKVQTTSGPLAKEIAPKGPIIKDAQCNPVDEYTRETILQGLQPPLSTYDGFYGHKDQSYNCTTDIKKFAKAVTKLNKSSCDKTATSVTMPPVLKFPGVARKYMIKRELGSGAFAPVYLIENVADEEVSGSDEAAKSIMGKGAFDGLSRKGLEALKMEDPPSPWEFYIMRQAKRRLGGSRAAESIINVYEMHLYADECYLIEEFRGQGTLLDIINIARADSASPGGVMDETLCMFFTVELFRTVEALHSKGILHGDLKADNCLVRLDQLPDSDVWSLKYKKDGSGGWNKKGIALIDFGRGIDMKVFRPEVQFIADWKTSPQDCAEMRELRPWTYQIDYHGLAGIIHSMLFGKYIDTVAEKGSGIGAGAQKRWKIKDGLKRYWQTYLWGNMFDLLLNPAMHVEGEEGSRLPVLKGMKAIREEMEAWLEGNSEKGVGLQALIRKLEWAVKEKRK
jgi:checkpoint serine/threonine-protein kinase